VRLVIFVSRGEAETRAFGARLALRLRGGEIIGLCGDLGAGKTCFVRGVAEGLGVPAQRVRSPTFTMINEYGGGRLPLYHVDLYRLQPSDVDRLALREYLYGEGVAVVEWFEHLGEACECLRVQFTFVEETVRRLVVTSCGQRYDRLLNDWERD
jgi:tRNA threonylcarbamoyladenosine biosynthesis protein TsaE